MKSIILFRNAAAVIALAFALGQSQFATAEGGVFKVYEDTACAIPYGSVGSFDGVEALHKAGIIHSFKYPGSSTCWVAH